MSESLMITPSRGHPRERRRSDPGPLGLAGQRAHRARDHRAPALGSILPASTRAGPILGRRALVVPGDGRSRRSWYPSVMRLLRVIAALLALLVAPGVGAAPPPTDAPIPPASNPRSAPSRSPTRPTVPRAAPSCSTAARACACGIRGSPPTSRGSRSSAAASAAARWARPCTSCRARVAPLPPRALVLYEGDNDIEMGLTPDEVMADFDSLLAACTRPRPGRGST